MARDTPAATDDGARPAHLPHPSRLFVEVTTRCNLRCAACVKQAPGQGLAEGDMSLETFSRLMPLMPGLDALILNGVGESLLHPHLERFIELARGAMKPSGWIGFQTNGQLLTHERAHALVAAGVDRVCVSADAVSPAVFRQLRAGGQQEAVETAVTALHRAARQTGRKLSLGVEFVAMRRNVHQLPDLVRWAARNHVDFIIVTQMLAYQRGMERAAAFDANTQEAQELFTKWRDRAQTDGVDMGRYFEVFSKFQPTADERRVIDYVERMVAEASAQGLTLHLRRLFQRDERLLERVRTAFAESEEVARREGLELRLPAVAPSQVRRCEFVEGGGAFVSWDGNLHPCYFLWHNYQCHIAGVAKQVRPHSFGSVGQHDALTLWNGDAWRTFRDGVLRYDFPFCYDCSLALCDYVQEGEFTQDCRISTVPCASCLWCTGVFQCLQ